MLHDPPREARKVRIPKGMSSARCLDLQVDGSLSIPAIHATAAHTMKPTLALLARSVWKGK